MNLVLPEQVRWGQFATKICGYIIFAKKEERERKELSDLSRSARNSTQIDRIRHIPASAIVGLSCLARGIW